MILFGLCVHDFHGTLLFIEHPRHGGPVKFIRTGKFTCAPVPFILYCVHDFFCSTLLLIGHSRDRVRVKVYTCKFVCVSMITVVCIPCFLQSFMFCHILLSFIFFPFVIVRDLLWTTTVLRRPESMTPPPSWSWRTSERAAFASATSI